MGALVAAGAVSWLTGCSGAEPRPARGVERIRYGADPQQYADLRRPAGEARGTVVLIHGGYWQAGYGADLMAPMARALTKEGYATCNVEYRRVGSGGGFPTTLEDVAAAIDRLARERLPATMVIGHSAGGHLAGWAASRTARTPGGAPAARLRGVVSLSGLLDLRAAALDPLSSAQTLAFVGGAPDRVPGRYAVADPTLLVPSLCPVTACQAAADEVIPLDQGHRYVAADTAAGGEADYVSVPGDHFALIDPAQPAFTTIRGLVARTVGEG